MCGTSLRRVGKWVLELLIEKGFDIVDPDSLDSMINRVSLLDISVA